MKKSTYTFLRYVLICTILVLALIVVQGLGVRFDFSRNAVFSFSSETISLAQNLIQEYGGSFLEITLLSDPGAQDQRVIAALGDLSRRISQCSLNIIPLNSNPMLLYQVRTNYGIDTIPNNSIVIQIADQLAFVSGRDLYEYASAPDQGPIVTAFRLESHLYRMMSSLLEKTVYTIGFLSGNGEPSFTELHIDAMLPPDQFVLRSIHPLRDGGIDQDIDVLVVSLPVSDYSEHLVHMLFEYVHNQGNILLMYDGAQGELPRFSSFVSSCGFLYEPSIILENNRSALLSQFQHTPFVFIPQIQEHQITSSLVRSDDVLIVAGVSPVILRQSFETTPILTSSGESLRVWVDREQSIPAPSSGYIVAAAFEDAEAGHRRVAIGTSALLQSLPGIGQIKGNVELWIESIHWILQDATQQRTLYRSLYQAPLRIHGQRALHLTLIFTLIIPLLLFICSIAIWKIRKRR